VDDERRRSARHDVDLPCDWSGSPGAPGRVIDLSFGGCFVQSPVVPAGNDEVTISLDAEPEHPLIGTTVYTLDGFGFAVRFPDADRRIRLRIERWFHD
jgi:hypothetical protein